MTEPRADRRVAFALSLAVLALYARSLHSGFVDLDDESNLVFNPYYHQAFWPSLKWMLGFHFVHWYPLTWATWSLDRLLWGLDPFGFHLTSAVLHAAAAALAYRAACRLIPAREAWNPGAAWAALLFAVHPLRVESVSWVTERSDVLCGALLLWSLCAHLEDRRRLSLSCYALALLAKATAVPFPLALAVLDRWRGRPALAGKAPHLILAALCAAANAYAQSRAGALWSVESLGPGARLLVAGYNAAFLLARTLRPARLMALYPMPDPFAAGPLLAASLAVLLLTAAVWSRRRERPELAAAWAWFLLFLAPVAGLVKTGPQLAADRYSYLSCLPFAALAGAWLAPRRRWWVGAAAVLALSAAAWRQQAAWKDSESLWSSMLARDPLHAVAANYLGGIRLSQGRAQEAELLLRRAASLKPCYGAAFNNLGNLLSRTGRPQEAVAAYRRALECEPGHPVGRRNLEEALRRLRP